MAKPATADIEAIYSIGEAAGMTRDEIDEIARPHIQQAFSIGTIRLTNVRSHGELRTIEHLVTVEASKRKAAAEAEAQAAPVAAPSEQTPATARQVEYILSLLARHGGGGFYQGPRDRGGIAQLTKAQASLYIDSLTDNY